MSIHLHAVSQTNGPPPLDLMKQEPKLQALHAYVVQMRDEIARTSRTQAGEDAAEQFDIMAITLEDEILPAFSEFLDSEENANSDLMQYRNYLDTRRDLELEEKVA